MLNKGITIKARIGLTMGFLAALLLIVGVLGLTGMSHANDAHHETFSNEMPSAVDIGNAELYAARERLALDRAAFLFGTPEVAATVERARLMRTTSDAWWKKYSDLTRGAEEDRLAQDVAAKRDTLHQALDAFGALVAGTDQSKVPTPRRTCKSNTTICRPPTMPCASPSSARGRQASRAPRTASRPSSSSASLR